MEESEVVEKSFQLIFAFDEIVALGYRENVNLAQIRTFTEMDSHEEKVFQAVREVTLMKENIMCFRGTARTHPWYNRMFAPTVRSRMLYVICSSNTSKCSFSDF